MVDIASNFQVYIAEPSLQTTMVLMIPGYFRLYNYPQAETKVFRSLVKSKPGYYQYWDGKTIGGRLLLDYYYVI